MSLNAVAIVPSAGLGRRFGQDRNKPFETLGDKPVLIWSLEAFQGMPEISEIIPVLKDSDISTAWELFKKYGITKVKNIATGGKERQDSVYSGLALVKDMDAVVVIHDGVRPLINPGTVRKALAALVQCDGVVIGVLPKDTIKETRGGLVRHTLKRDDLLAVQTPQIFYYKPLMEAYNKAMGEAYYATDDSALVEKNGGTIKIQQGEYTNIKVTTPEDLVIAEALLTMRRESI